MKPVTGLRLFATACLGIVLFWAGSIKYFDIYNRSSPFWFLTELIQLQARTISRMSFSKSAPYHINPPVLILSFEALGFLSIILITTVLLNKHRGKATALARGFQLTAIPIVLYEVKLSLLDMDDFVKGISKMTNGTWFATNFTNYDLLIISVIILAITLIHRKPPISIGG